MANVITSLRIMFSVALLFCRPFSVPFFSFYLAAGFSDMIDGTVARKTGTASEFGSRLDTVADFVFVAACLFKLLPVLAFEKWVPVWILIIVVIKAFNVILGFVLYRKMMVVHSVLNKITGAAVFLIPLLCSFIELRFLVIAACVLTTAAAIVEGADIMKLSSGATKKSSRP